MEFFDYKNHSAKLDKLIKDVIDLQHIDKELLIILIGDNPASLKYIGVKRKLCEELGIKTTLLHLSEQLSDAEIFAEITKAFANDTVGGGIIQLPLPRPILLESLKLIPPNKDIDLLSSKNVEQYYAGDLYRLPPVVRAFGYFVLSTEQKLELTQKNVLNISLFNKLIKENLKSKKVHILGNGMLVGKPISHYLRTLDVPIHISENYIKGDKIYSDYLILGTGVPNLVDGGDITSGCNIIDFGTGILEEKVTGDLNLNTPLSHLGLVCKSPGGIGPVVVRSLILNFITLLPAFDNIS
jgi:methylenetetrahydrofolate dehydrogenase (NADP+) / methenyltetrahydrofolate cyclohydrolase